MFCKLVQSTLLLVLLAITMTAQVRREAGSIEERALRLEPFITESAKHYGVDVRVLRIVCLVESRYRLVAISPKGARGPMQFMPETARRYGLQNPHDPKAAIDAAAQYLRDLLARFGGRLDLALAAYNAGEGTVDSFRTGHPLMLANGKIINPRGLVTGGIPPYRETRVYVKSAIALLASSNATSLNPVAFPTLRKRPTPRTGPRDFTVDAMKKLLPSRRSQETSALFIEIQ
jgi:soluble lytic murein transglycosylase-like protein